VKFTDGGSNVGLPSTDDPFIFEHVQHEHALVTVDDDFRIIRWDHYGDDAEQNYTDEASVALIAELCSKDIYPLEVCAGFAIGDGSDAEVVEIDEKDGNIRRTNQIMSKASAVREANRILANQFPVGRGGWFPVGINK